MKVTTIAVISLVMLLALAGSSQAQVDCDEISIPWPSDTIKVITTTGKPGDTVLVPLYLTNTLTVSAFEIYLEFDKTLIEPLFKWNDTNIITTCTLWSDDPEVCSLSRVDTFVTPNYEWYPTSRFDISATLFELLAGEIEFTNTDTNIQRLKFLALPDW